MSRFRASVACCLGSRGESRSLPRASVEALKRYDAVGRSPVASAMRKHACIASITVALKVSLHAFIATRCILRYGIIETLDQSFSAPQIVKQYLDDETHITKSLFGALEAQVRIVVRARSATCLTWRLGLTPQWLALCSSL